ncbi:uncharacterized protein [Haliotis asinina]|uniref:uncharacterized protein n=1 Tax=Haliotis asinina TaxID=109174 RepID=UPI003531E8CF
MNTTKETPPPWTSITHEREVNSLAGVVYIVISTAIVIANSFIIFINTKTKESAPTVRCLTCIACTNLISGLTIILYEVPYSLVPRLSCSDPFMTTMKLVRVTLHSQTVYQCVLCVLDRYLCLCRPRLYTQVTSARWIIGAVVLSFLLSGGALLLMFFQSIQKFDEMSFGCSPVFANTNTTPVLVLVVIVIPAVVIFGCYVSIGREFIRRHCAIAPIETELPFKFPRMAVWVLCSFFVCYFPSVVAAMLNSLSDSSTSPVSDNSWMVADISRHLYSVWSVLIFTGSFSPFRKQVFKLFCKLDGTRVEGGVTA